MERILSIAMLLVLLSFCLASANNIKLGRDGNSLSINRPTYVPGELLVKYKPYADPAAIEQFQDRGKIKVLKKMKRAKLRHVKLPPDLDVKEAIKVYESDPNVEYAEPNYYVCAEATTPNDTDFTELWGLHNTGQAVNGSAGTADADIDAPEAWDITTGSSDVIVAVIDSGVAYDHPELVENIWTNTGEVPGDGIDNDGNGYVDDIHGWDFVENDNDPMDYSSHGTHVAGTIAGVSDNARGITGVMWDAQIMPLRFLDTIGSGTTDNAILAIDYAIENGARILNNSWGGGYYSQTLEEAIERAKAAGALFIAAAGNNGQDNDTTPHYPSGYDIDNIIAVAATDQNDDLVSFSNYGATSVDVAAPGTNIYSTIPAREVIFTDDFDDGNITGWTTGGTNNTWDVTTEAYHSASYSLTDSPYANYLNNTDSWARSPVINLSGRTGCKWIYYMDLDVEYDSDWLYIETSTDNITWDISGGWTGSTGGDFYEFVEDLTPYDGTPTIYVRFRLDSDSNFPNDSAYIDDVELSCSSDQYSAGTQYEHFFNGTSMAAPHVAGLAGLIWSRPDTAGLTYTQVKELILTGVDTITALDGKMVTGGRINAYNSLLKPPYDATGTWNCTETSIWNSCDPVQPESGTVTVTQTGNDVTLTDDEEGRTYTGTVSGVTYALFGSFSDDPGETETVNITFTLPSEISGSGTASWFWTDGIKTCNGGREFTLTKQAAGSGDGSDDDYDEGGGGGGGGCFIATAAFGSPMERDVTILKNLRDTYLLPCALGRSFVRTYNKYSPPLAHFISKHETFKVAVRISLVPLVAVSYGTLHFGPVVMLVMVVVFVILSISLVLCYRRKGRSYRANN